MSVLAWIAIGLGAWTLVSVAAGLVLGQVFARARAVDPRLVEAAPPESLAA